jgi:hypothetical protein
MAEKLNEQTFGKDQNGEEDDSVSSVSQRIVEQPNLVI